MNTKDQKEQYKYYAYADADNTYTIKLPELKDGFKYRIITKKENEIVISIIKKGLFK